MAPSLADITVETADGEPARLGALVDRPTVLVIPRYYGCMPCRDYLGRISERLDDVEAVGAGALGVSVGAAHQARWLRDERGVAFPLLVDGERKVYEAIDLPSKWWVGLNPRGWWNYAKAIMRGGRQGRILAPNQLPGLAILDAEARAVWVHRGKALGDYPPVDEVLRRLERVGAVGA